MINSAQRLLVPQLTKMAPEACSWSHSVAYLKAFLGLFWASFNATALRVLGDHAAQFLLQFAVTQWQLF